jgi:hypothetical protein
MVGQPIDAKTKAAIIAHKGGETNAEIAAKFGVSRSAVQRIRQSAGVRNRSDYMPFTDDDIATIEAMRAEGAMAAQIAAKLGRTVQSIAAKAHSLKMSATVAPEVKPVAPWVARALHAFEKQGYNRKP